MLAERTVAHDDKLRFTVPAANFLEGFYESGEAIPRVESSEEEDDRNIGAESSGAGNVRIEDVGIDSIGDDRPVGLEVSIERDRRGVRDRDRRVELIESLLKVSPSDGVADRAIEIGVKGADDGAVRLFDRQHRQNGTERRMYVNDVVLAQTEHPLQIFSQLPAPCKSRLRSVGVYRLALPNPNDVGLVPRARNVGRDDVHLMSVSPRFAREEVDVLADAAQVWVVVLCDERDSERTRSADASHRQRSCRHQLEAARVAELTLQERHGLRLTARLVL